MEDPFRPREINEGEDPKPPIESQPQIENPPDIQVDLNDEPETESLQTISDSEDSQLRLKLSTERQRPSFTIGGSSDSDSTLTSSIDSYGRYRKHSDRSIVVKHKSELKPIQSVSHNSRSGSPNSNSNGDGSVGESAIGGGDYTKIPKPGYMGGSTPKRSSSDLNLRLRDTSVVDELSNNANTDDEIRLFATEGSSGEGFSRRQWITFVVFGFVELLSAMIISLQAPFYPQEAEKKMATATEYGLVFGIFELTVFLISPIYGSHIAKIGSKRVFNMGIFTTAVSSILFGFLDKIDDRALFIGLSIGTRIVEALGEAAFITASFVIIAAEFNQSVATTFAAMETFYGFGLIIGPMAGGFLYQIGGYSLPFFSVGGLLLVAALLTTCVLPKTQDSNKIRRRMISGSDNNVETNAPSVSVGGFKMFKLIMIPSVALSALSIFSASTSIGYLNATLEPHLRQFNLSQITTGAVFIVNGGMYALSAPFWGYFSDSISHLKYITLFGSMCIMIGFGLIGPIPYVPLETSLWGIIVGQVIQGIGLGAVLVSAFIQALRDATKSGFADDIATYGLVSGIWTSMFALGSFAGPTVAGVLFDIVGFRVGTLSVEGLMMITVIFIMISICCQCCSSSNQGIDNADETRPLLRSQSSSTRRRYDERSKV